MTIIAITGKMQSGKTTLARAIVKQIRKDGGTPTIRPFAEPLKEIAYDLGWNGEKDAKGRRLLQLLGTEVGRECVGPDVWVDKWRHALPKNSGYAVIVDDLRFANEAKAIREMGGIIVRITRKDRRPWWKRLLYRITEHKSERASFPVDATFPNNDSIDDLDLVAAVVMSLVAAKKQAEGHNAHTG